MTLKLQTLSFNSERQLQMVEFFRAIGIEMHPKNVTVGSQAFAGQMGDLEIQVFSTKKSNPPPLPTISIRMEVPELSQVIRRIAAVQGAQVLMDPEMMPDGKKAIVLCPDGHSFEIIEPWAST